MTKPFVYAVLVMIVLVAPACSGKISDASNPTVPSSETRMPTESGQNADSSSEETPKEGTLKRTVAAVERVEIREKESFPKQITIVMEGMLPTPCHQIRTKVHPVNEKKEIEIEVYSLVDPAAMCAQVLAPFEVQVDLGSYPEGEYKVLVNTEERGRFEMP